MGMAASQARYIMLTGRKSDLEYQGQQINQQRTALAQESSGLFQKMMTLTPPSVSDYQSSPEDTSADWSTMGPNGNGIDVYGNPYAWVGTQSQATTTVTTDNNGTPLDLTDDYTITTVVDNNGTSGDISDDITTTTTTGTAPTVARTDSTGTPTTTTSVQDNGTPSDTSDDYTLRTTVYDMGTAGDTSDDVTVTERISVTTQDSGDNTILNLTTFPTEDGIDYLWGSAEYSSTTEDNYINDSYEKAVINYNYEMEQANLKTEVIHQQDRALEMQLRNIDTQHKAVSTEMDAVKDVIKKNIDSTFKTFK